MIWNNFVMKCLAGERNGRSMEEGIGFYYLVVVKDNKLDFRDPLLQLLLKFQKIYNVHIYGMRGSIQDYTDKIPLVDMIEYAEEKVRTSDTLMSINDVVIDLKEENFDDHFNIVEPGSAFAENLMTMTTRCFYFDTFIDEICDHIKICAQNEIDAIERNREEYKRLICFEPAED